MKNTRLEQIRVELGLNKTEFAEAMGISSNYYYNILSDDSRNTIRLEHLESLLLSRKVNPVWIMTGEGERYINLPDHPDQKFVAGHIVPGLPVTRDLDKSLLEYVVLSVMAASGLPMLSSDLAYGILVDYCTQYIGRNPSATRDQIDIPVMTASFLALLQTAQKLIDLGFEMNEGKVAIRFAGQTYNFVRHDQPDK